MPVIGTGGRAFYHNVQPPRQTDAHDTAYSAARDALTSQAFNRGTLLVCNDTIFGSGHNLSLTRFTVVILLAMAVMAVFLVLIRSARWARGSDDHGRC
jgi:hypothetical protein